ncbi:MAG: thioredoxin [Patescibacteria group bacterium]
MAKKTTDKKFEEEVLEEDEAYVLVDFWAPWCNPCKMLGPVVDKIAENYDESELKVRKMNVDENKEKPAEYNVSGIPTLLLFKDGEVVHKMVGFKPFKAFKAELDEQLEDN